MRRFEAVRGVTGKASTATPPGRRRGAVLQLPWVSRQRRASTRTSHAGHKMIRPPVPDRRSSGGVRRPIGHWDSVWYTLSISE
jgi:hypothetical protein